ncbi:MAG: hypothetical protein FWC58_06155 [Desulfobulbus sp.]|nr:hypothetical protein [Desulfobulbus sp.]
MLNSSRSALGRFLLALALCLSLPLAAQTESGPVADPPGRVGRLGQIEGEVTFRPQREATADPATANWPLSSGAVLETGADGRAEAWIGSIALRLGQASRLEFTALDDRQALLDLTAGRFALSVMDAEQVADLRLRSPDGQVRFTAAGRYRLDVLADRSELTVFAGSASIEHDGGNTQLAAGKRATLFADGNLRIDEAGRPDAFDRWVAERENATVASAARSHVSPGMTGFQDLDTYGDWNNNSDYGAVWFPRAVASDWAPYRFGRWAWIAPWGWTWIDAAPWGFAPFHYGRWVMLGGRWAWVPGQRSIRPVYAPALVAWIGNPGWSVSFGFGAAPAVGWFPLAPREVFVPYFRFSPAFIWRLNIAHVHDVTIIERAVRGGPPPRFAFRDSPQAVTVIPAQKLREGRPIGARDFQRIERRDLERAPASAGRDWLAPTAEARRPWAEARPGQPGAPGLAGPSGRPGPERRDDIRSSPAPFAAAPNRRDGPAAALTPRQPWTGNRQPEPMPPRESRDMPHPAATAGARQSPATPAQAPYPAPSQRMERGDRPAPPSANLPGAPTPAIRRDDAFQRPAAGMPNAQPSRPQPAPEMRPSREIMRPAPQPDEGRSFRRAEPEAPRPAMRGPEVSRDRERGSREQSDSSDRPGRGDPSGGGRGGERGSRWDR